MTAEEFAALLTIAKLSPEDKAIATQCIVWRMELVVVGVEHNMDRSTISRRLGKVILPELERMLVRLPEKQQKAGA